ncbi:glucose 1-dehydrogenase [Porticoccaceae bacterium]|nr:glucose 1-dehydrogenase [Porticoccaceae bacterium]
MNRLADKVALITGGAAGLGREIVKCFLKEGAQVIVTDINAKRGSQLAELTGCEFICQDVTSEDEWLFIIKIIESRYGKLDILINNAGIEGPMSKATASPESTKLEDWQRVQAVNVDGVFIGCRAAIPAMRRSGGGSIINISSVAALLPTPEHVAYGVSKAAVRHLTTSIAMHCATDQSKIRCNSIHPGTILTPMLERIIAEKSQNKGISEDQMLEQLKTEIPQGEFQLPEDIAAAAVFLASDESKHITGTKMVVDGGYTLST